MHPNVHVLRSTSHVFSHLRLQRNIMKYFAPITVSILSLLGIGASQHNPAQESITNLASVTFQTTGLPGRNQSLLNPKQSANIAPSANSSGGVTINGADGEISSAKGVLNAITDCGLPPNRTSDSTSALNTCLAAYINKPPVTVIFPKLSTIADGCDYTFTAAVVMPQRAPRMTLQAAGSSSSAAIFCFINDTAGIIVEGDYDSVRYITVRGKSPWRYDNLSTYVVTGTSDGVRACASDVTLDNIAASDFSRHGIAAGSAISGCQKGALSDGNIIVNPTTYNNRGDGIHLRGGDASLNTIIGGRTYFNQFFGIADQGLYGGVIINLNSDGNHNDGGATGTTYNIASCSVSNGVMTITTTGINALQNYDFVTIAGTGARGACNGHWVFTPITVTSPTTFTMLTGDLGPADGTKVSGGRVIGGPGSGSDIWAKANMYGGCGVGSTQGGGGSNFQNMYCEGNQPGLMINPETTTVYNGQGATTPNTWWFGQHTFANELGSSVYRYPAPGTYFGPKQGATYQYYNPFTRRRYDNYFTIGSPDAGISAVATMGQTGTGLYGTWCIGSDGWLSLVNKPGCNASLSLFRAEVNSRGQQRVWAVNGISIGYNGGTAPKPITDSVAIQKHMCAMDIDGGSGTGGVVVADNSLVSKCYNDFGATLTVLAVRCFSNNNGTTTVLPKVTGGANLLTGALKCSTSWASGTLNGTPTLTSGSTLDMVAAPDGTSKLVHVEVTLTF
jgi:hypothetical protein